MKKTIFLFLTLCSVTIVMAQKKANLKGSKIVTVVKHNVAPFAELEIEDNLEITLVKGTKSAIEIEADENLHAAINHENHGNSLRLNTNKNITGFEKLQIKVIYTDTLKLIYVRHEAKLNAISELQLPSITVKAYDYSKSFMNVNAANFTLLANDKAKIELNLKSQDVIIEMSKNAILKSLISSPILKLDMYQKTEVTLEGDITEIKLRLDNNAKYTGKNATSKIMNLTTEGATNCSVFTNGALAINASGKSEIWIYGEPKIELQKFADDATLYKKSKVKE
jgi:hypothetical protein